MSSYDVRNFAVADGALPKELFGYEIIDFIGEGAASVIYVVSHLKSKQLYALKHVVRKTDKHERFIEQLEAEYEIGKQVNHPGLRRCIDIQYNRTLLRKVTEAVLVMELFDGRPLDMLNLKSISEILDVFIQTGEALKSLHGLGFVHCDLKPNNILLAPGGEVKVIDLGQACPIGTAKKRIQGTPDFIAPEQMKCKPVTEKTDIFNFGATLYWQLTKQKMPTLYTVKKDDNSFLVDDQVPTPASLNRSVPETLSNLVMECCRTNPAKRPEDMSEIVRRLEIIQHAMIRRQQTAKTVA